MARTKGAKDKEPRKKTGSIKVGKRKRTKQEIVEHRTASLKIGKRKNA